jgi:hypothetical protein
MATGRVASTQLAATTLTQIYQVPTGYYGVYNVSFTNTSGSPVTIRLAIASTNSPGTSEYYEYGTNVIASGVFERTGLVVQGGYYIFAYTSAGSAVNVNVYGIETSTS